MSNDKLPNDPTHGNISAAFQTARRYLRAAAGLSPEERRARWGLPADYPAAAPGDAAAETRVGPAADTPHQRDGA